MSSTQGVEVVDSGPKVSKPVVIVGVPEAGLVGTIASSYLVEQLKMQERGYIDSEFMPPVMVVHNSVARYPVHIFGKDNTLLVMSEVPLTGRVALEVSQEVASWTKSLRASLLVGITGAPSRSREEAQGDGVSSVVGVGTGGAALDALKKSGALPFEEGVLSGFYASLLKSCIKEGQSGVVLLAESLLEFPDPGAASSIISSLNNLLSLNVDTRPLTQEAEEIRVRTRELMKQTQQAQQQQSAPPSSAGTAYR